MNQIIKVTSKKESLYKEIFTDIRKVYNKPWYLRWLDNSYKNITVYATETDYLYGIYSTWEEFIKDFNDTEFKIICPGVITIKAYVKFIYSNGMSIYEYFESNAEMREYIDNILENHPDLIIYENLRRTPRKY